MGWRGCEGGWGAEAADVEGGNGVSWGSLASRLEAAAIRCWVVCPAAGPVGQKPL